MLDELAKLISSARGMILFGCEIATYPGIQWNTQRLPAAQIVHNKHTCVVKKACTMKASTYRCPLGWLRVNRTAQSVIAAVEVHPTTLGPSARGYRTNARPQLYPGAHGTQYGWVPQRCWLGGVIPKRCWFGGVVCFVAGVHVSLNTFVSCLVEKTKSSSNGNGWMYRDLPFREYSKKTEDSTAVYTAVD